MEHRQVKLESSSIPGANALFAKKSVEMLKLDAAESTFTRSLGLIELTALGIGMIIGAGIFVLTGAAAAYNAGPAIVVSFIVGGITSMFVGLCYAEMASIIPVSGSTYTYSYATMGSLVGWTIGWDLMLEYLAGGATVCVGWSAYFKSCMTAFGMNFSDEWTSSPLAFDKNTGQFTSTGNFINLPAVIIVLFVTCIATMGIKESSHVNILIVLTNFLVIILFIVVMTPKINPDNWEPFLPPNEGKFGEYGISGIFQGASLVFYAYLGFDGISTFALESHNPKRDLPIATLASLGICTVLYVLVALVATGLIPYYEYKGIAHPISYAVEQFPGYTWLIVIINFGALAGLTSVLLGNQLAQARIVYTMVFDGFLPKFLGNMHPVFHTPWIATLISGVLCALLAGFFPVDVLGEMTSVGTLFAFYLLVEVSPS